MSTKKASKKTANKTTSKFKVGDKVAYKTGSLCGTIISIDHAYCSIRDDLGTIISQVVLKDLLLVKKKPATKTYRIFAEWELKASTPDEAKNQFLSLLEEYDTAIEIVEQEITEPNIDRAVFIDNYKLDI